MRGALIVLIPASKAQFDYLSSLRQISFFFREGVSVEFATDNPLFLGFLYARRNPEMGQFGAQCAFICLGSLQKLSVLVVRVWTCLKCVMDLGNGGFIDKLSQLC